jgi:serine O-acetyltransferase
MNTEISNIIKNLSQTEGFRDVCHECGANDSMPSTDVLKEIVQIARSILFPGYFGNAEVNQNNMVDHIELNINQLHLLLLQQIRSGICFTFNGASHDMNIVEQEAQEKATIFITQLPEIREKLYTDVVAAYNGDPAAKSFGEVIFCYPSIRAISNYRIANALLKLNVPLIPRIITEMAHSETGIDIHPGATIGNYFTIDHGTGVVIGETATIGNNVKMYQGVTLGAKSFPLDEDGNPIKGIQRHPHIGNNVIIYSNSTILGTITVGDGAVIGGNLWVDTDVPAGAKLAQNKRVTK